MAPMLDWIGCIFGLLGALMLALNLPQSRYGFWAYLVSNLAWIGYSALTAQIPLLLQTMGFLVTTLIGIYRWRGLRITRSGGETTKLERDDDDVLGEAAPWLLQERSIPD